MKVLYIILTSLVFLSSGYAVDYFYVNQSVLDLYTEPDSDSMVASQAVYATPVEIVRSEENWTLIETPDRFQGWVAEGLITRTAPYFESGSACYVNTLWAHIYPVSKALRHPPIMTLPFGTALEIVSSVVLSEKPWLEVCLLDGTKAWIQGYHVTTEKQLLCVEEMLALSQCFLGIPYRFGGVSAFGFDCSGFTQMLYGQMGIAIPRKSYLQAADERSLSVKREELQPGDLLFFGKKPPKVTHVGLYMGNDQFIHASNSVPNSPSIVRVNSLADPVWDARFVSACRHSLMTSVRESAHALSLQ